MKIGPPMLCRPLTALLLPCATASLFGACDPEPPEPDCYKSKYNCAFDNPLGGNRVKRDDGKSVGWPLKPINGKAAILRDGNGTPFSTWDEAKMPPYAQFNFGQTRVFAGETFAFALTSPNLSAAWLPIAAIVDKDEFMSNVGHATLGGSGLKKMGCYTVKGSYDLNYGELKVRKPEKYDEEFMKADDYLARLRENNQRSVNLVHQVPGTGLGGTAIDHFPVGTRFQRLRVPMFDATEQPSILVKLYKKDTVAKTWVLSKKTMKFLYGYVATKTGERRYGWMPFEALKTAGKACPNTFPLNYNPQDPPPPDPQDPPPPDPQDPPPPDPQDPPPPDPQDPPPDPCSECANTQCASTLSACDGNAECGAVYECVDSCPETCLSCWPACWEQHPGGKDSFTAHGECMQQNCQAACDLYTPCDEQSVACDSNPECAAIFVCIKATCPSECPPDNPTCALPCWGGCMDQHPAAKDQFNSLMQCENSGC